MFLLLFMQGQDLPFWRSVLNFYILYQLLPLLESPFYINLDSEINGANSKDYVRSFLSNASIVG